jgi:high-affinity iron transporter
MGRIQPGVYRGFLALLGACLACLSTRSARGGDVSGVVRMPEICSPAVSPAVVYLRPVPANRKDARPDRSRNRGAAGENRLAELVLVNQRGLQFVPRVQAIELGQTLRFTNQDGETHNVHVASPHFLLNQSMSPGQLVDFAPDHAGLMKVVCDVHHHMRGYVVVSPTPWFGVCDRDGRFRLVDVPAGHYVLNVWHEMGDPLRTEIDVAEGRIEVPLLVLSLPAGLVGSDSETARANEAPVRPWSEVIDRISVMLAESRDAAMRHGEPGKARRLVDDAYWGEFETSEMETAIRKYVGYARSGELERQFHDIAAAAQKVGSKRESARELVERCDRLIAELVAVTKVLDSKGITDRSKIDPIDVASVQLDSSLATPDGDPRLLLHALERGFRRVEKAAQRAGPLEAAAELSSVYMTEFEPLERYLLGRRPQEVRPLEIQFYQLRGDVSAGLSGEALSARLGHLSSQVERLVAELETQPAGRFGSAFAASFITIVREGVEVILILAMLLALIGKATSAAGLRALHGSDRAPDDLDIATPELGRAAFLLKERAVRAIWWGVAAAALASIATAVALNFLIVSAPGAAREMLEGFVMLVAAAVLFYVSYWLISRFEAKRWTDYLAERARRGIALGGQGTLALTAFLAVYREGAETSLLYQALLGSEGRTRAGLLGLAAGVVLGVVILAIIAAIVRATSVRLPMQLFFKLSGIFLFVMAIMFAGNGVFELQNAGILVTTNLAWMGRGLPWAGIFPTVQVVSVQGLLLFGAVAAWLLVPRSALGLGAGPPRGV